jgi:hypothetical protein
MPVHTSKQPKDSGKEKENMKLSKHLLQLAHASTGEAAAASTSWTIWRRPRLPSSRRERRERSGYLPPEMPPGTPPAAAEAETRRWENAAAGAAAGFATVAALHPLDVVRTRFQGNPPFRPYTLGTSERLRRRATNGNRALSLSCWRAVSGGRGWSEVPPYRNTAHAVYTITRSEVSSTPTTFPWTD